MKFRTAATAIAQAFIPLAQMGRSMHSFQANILFGLDYGSA
jgi:hypothetical protein